MAKGAAHILSLQHVGRHNAEPARSRDRLIRGGGYKNQATVAIFPSRGDLHPKVVASWMNLLTPMNQKFLRLWPLGMEIGEAYSQTVEQVLADPELAGWKYLLTIEADNIVPPDGLIRLLESIEGGVDGKRYDAMGSLYWTKGEGGQPMIYGDPTVMPRNFLPQLPLPDTVQPCNGLGMGFTLFRLSMFKDPAIPRPLFKTVSSYAPGQGIRVYTQDLHFFENALGLGYRFACDTRVKVGHYDAREDIVW